MSVQSGTMPLAVTEQPPGPVPAQWMAVARCPSCDSGACAFRAALADRHYVFGAEQVAFPDRDVEIVECGDCGLYYKTPVPAPAFIEAIFMRQAQKKWTGTHEWTGTHDFSREAAVLRRLKKGASFDLLDVGAADGAFLEACTGNGATGRRSALDVIRYSGIERRLAGEFIEGFLDDPLLAWGREPYDVVTLFDVLEHLYRPRAAFENLRSLLRADGLVFVETGNAGSFWSRRIGIHRWWYARLLEHHVFWSRNSLSHIAAAHGFRIVHWREGRHKSRRELVPAGIARDLLKTGLYCITAGQYASIARLFGRQGNQPWFPFARDHFQACLVKA